MDAVEDEAECAAAAALSLPLSDGGSASTSSKGDGASASYSPCKPERNVVEADADATDGDTASASCVAENEVANIEAETGRGKDGEDGVSAIGKWSDGGAVDVNVEPTTADDADTNDSEENAKESKGGVSSRRRSSAATAASDYQLTTDELELFAELQKESEGLLRAEAEGVSVSVDDGAVLSSLDDKVKSKSSASENAERLAKSLESLRISGTVKVIEESQRNTAATLDGVLVRLKNFNTFSAKALPGVLAEIGPCMERVEKMKAKMNDVTARLAALRRKAEKCWVPSTIDELSERSEGNSNAAALSTRK